MHQVICLPPLWPPTRTIFGQSHAGGSGRGWGAGEGMHDEAQIKSALGLLSLKILNFDIKLVLIDLAFLFTRLKLFECIIRSWYTVSTSA